MTRGRFTSFDGTTIAYQQWSPAEPVPGRPPVILHHGFAVDGDVNWVDPGVVERLLDDGFEVVAIDARGHGQSDKPHDPDRYGEDAMSLDVSALADHLGLREFDLVGYSMGAIVSVVNATHEPRIRRMVIGGVGAGVVELGGVDTRAVKPEDIVAALTAPDAEHVRGPGKAFRQMADATGADRHALAAHASAVRQGPIAFEDIRARALVVVGDDDDLAERPEVLASAVGGQLVVVDGDHLTAVADPRFVEVISSFLADAD